MPLFGHAYSPEQILNFAAGALVLLGLGTYSFIILRNRHHFDLKNNTRELVGEVFAHVDHSRGSALPHIIAGISFIGGLAILLASAVAILIFGDSASLNVRLALASISIGILFSSISLWTLWQTRRITFGYGTTITEMEDLVRHLNIEIDKLIASFRDVHKSHAQPYHRFLLVTTQPLFGSLTPIRKELSEHFQSNLRKLATCQRDTIDPESPFSFQIVCGDQPLINEFHREYFGKNDNEINRMNDVVESLLADLERDSLDTHTVVIRKASIPPVQFAIVGNSVFTFSLQTADATTVIDGSRHADIRHVAAYRRTFEFLKEI